MSNDNFVEDVLQEEILPEGFVEGLHEWVDADNKDKGFQIKSVPVVVEETPTRIITKGAYQRRFSLQEEVCLVTVSKSNPLVEVILRRLDTTAYVDLDDADTIYSTEAVVDILSRESMLAEGVTSLDRVEQLLSDGTDKEKYNGVL